MHLAEGVYLNGGDPSAFHLRLRLQQRVRLRGRRAGGRARGQEAQRCRQLSLVPDRYHLGIFQFKYFIRAALILV